MTRLLIRRAHDRSGLFTNTTDMAWRPYENLINGQLDNRVPGKVTGWIRFYRRSKTPLKVSFDLRGDFHEDIRGSVIRLTNLAPSDRNESLDRKGTYMEGFSIKQLGDVGDITSGRSLGLWTPEIAQKLMAQNELIWDREGVHGAEREQRRTKYADRHRQHIDAGDLFYPYVTYPYIEWYSTNGRVVLELEPSQIEVLTENALVKEKTSAELLADDQRRSNALMTFLGNIVSFSRSRRSGGTGTARHRGNVV